MASASTQGHGVTKLQLCGGTGWERIVLTPRGNHCLSRKHDKPRYAVSASGTPYNSILTTYKLNLTAEKGFPTSWDLSMLRGSKHRFISWTGFAGTKRLCFTHPKMIMGPTHVPGLSAETLQQAPHLWSWKPRRSPRTPLAVAGPLP